MLHLHLSYIAWDNLRVTAGPFRHRGFCTGKKQQSRHAAALSFLDFYTNTLVKSHNYGTSQLLIGTVHHLWSFSIAMLCYVSLLEGSQLPSRRRRWLQLFATSNGFARKRWISVGESWRRWVASLTHRCRGRKNHGFRCAAPLSE